MPAPSPITKRFWEKVNKSGPTIIPELGPCWVWTGSTRGKGYGAIHLNGKMESAHRVAWLLQTGNWPEPQACHSCDNASCVRFSHLFEGTNKDNQHDKAKKGRASSQQGEQCGAAKLTNKEVLYIRKAFAKGAKGAHLAEMFGVSPCITSRIKRGLIWKSVL